MKTTKLSVAAVLSAALLVGCSSTGHDAPAPTITTAEQAAPETTATAAADTSTSSESTEGTNAKDLAEALINPDDPSTVYDGVTISDLFSALETLNGYETQELIVDSDINSVEGQYLRREDPTMASVQAYMALNNDEPHPLANVNDPEMEFFFDKARGFTESQNHMPVEKAVNTPNFEWKCFIPEGVQPGDVHHSICFTTLAGRVIEVHHLLKEKRADAIGPVDNLLALVDGNLAALK